MTDLTDAAFALTSSRLKPGMSYAGEHDRATFHHCSDRSLADLSKQYRRAFEDGRVSDGTTPYTFEFLGHWVDALRSVRERLRDVYGARDSYGPEGDRGTDIYDHHERLGHPPSYALAFAIDRARFERDMDCVVAWSAGEPRS